MAPFTVFNYPCPEQHYRPELLLKLKLKSASELSGQHSISVKALLTDSGKGKKLRTGAVCWDSLHYFAQNRRKLAAFLVDLPKNSGEQN